MITAVDTDVLLDVFLPDPEHGETSAALLKDAYDSGALVLCDVVFAELAPVFPDRRSLERALAALGVRLVPLDAEIAFEGGKRWNEYRRSGGKRNRILPDFLIAAHALLRADRLLTRDRGFYRTHFRGLGLVGPRS